MDAWRAHVLPTGESPHASTFYAHPLACAGALAALRRLGSPAMRRRVERAGTRLAEGLGRIAARHEAVGEARSAGLLGSIELVRDRERRTPAPEVLERLLRALRAAGILALPAGTHGNVLQLLPPLTIRPRQLSHALAAIDAALGAPPRGP